ncbi:MAG: glycosyltransferase family 4 protein [Limisphaerales bacterium]
MIGSNYKLIVAGKVERVKRCPPNVYFFGPVIEPGVLYAAADLMVFPPIYEPSSNVVYESLVAGLPVITSAENGAHEIITEGGKRHNSP